MPHCSDESASLPLCSVCALRRTFVRSLGFDAISSSTCKHGVIPVPPATMPISAYLLAS